MKTTRRAVWSYVRPEVKKALETAARRNIRTESNMVEFILTAYLRAGYYLPPITAEPTHVDYGPAIPGQA
jgi:hypothetical protein